MKDNYGDKIKVEANDESGDVALRCFQDDGDNDVRCVIEYLAPKKARRLAAKLLLASYQAEANA